jgi:hypothetical protein
MLINELQEASGCSYAEAVLSMSLEDKDLHW